MQAVGLHNEQVFSNKTGAKARGKMTTWRNIKCTECGGTIRIYANPFPTVDIIINVEKKGIVLIKRKNPPHGWAIPGGFVDYGESVENAAKREALEETGLDVTLQGILGVYSDPERDSRMHTISTVFVATAMGMPHAGDDAAEAQIFAVDQLPSPLCFDHHLIMQHYLEWTRGSRCLCPIQSSLS